MITSTLYFQVLIGQMYDGGHLVIENEPKKT
jgi:hypothetical protein